MKYFFFFVFAVCMATPAGAQLIFSSSDFLSQQQGGQTYTGFQDTAYSAADQQALLGLINDTGIGQTWTFGGSNWLSEGNYTTTTDLFPYPDNAPLAEVFPGATHVIVNPYYVNDTPFDFYTIDNTGLWDLGETQDSVGFLSEVLSYSPPQELFAFPLQYGVSWQTNSTEPINTFPSGSIVMQLTTGACDGVGTLSVPGRSEPAIRVTQTQTGSASFFGLSLGSSTTTTYWWFTKSGFTASMHTSSDYPGQISQATYRVPAGSSVFEQRVGGEPLTLRLSQNPASNTGSKLYYTMPQDGPVQIMLMDPLGRDVRMLMSGRANAGQNELPIDASALESGSYFLHVNADGNSSTLKLLITK